MVNSFKIGEIIETSVTEVSYQGLGVERRSDVTIFTLGLFIGEKAKVKVFYKTSKLLFCYPIEITHSHALRKFIPSHNLLMSNIAPFLPFSYNVSKEWKRDYLRQQFKWNFPNKCIEFSEIVPAPFEYHNRNKVKYFIEIKDGKAYFAVNRFNSTQKLIVEKEQMQKTINKNLSSALNLLLEYLNSDLAEKEIKKLISISGRINTKNEVQVLLEVTNDLDFSKIEKRIKSIPEVISLSILLDSKYKKVLEKKPFEIKILDKSFIVDIQSFFQTDTLAFEGMLNFLKSIIDLSKFRRIIDLYCGTGVIGISLKNEEQILVGMDISEHSINNAKMNAHKNKQQNTAFYAGDVSDNLRQININSEDLVILDPSRDGLEDKTIEDLSQLNVQNVLYISCNPRTLIRDLKKFSFEGYSFDQVSGFDNFPFTPHIESVVLLSKK
ncbi:class I SAM-dependent RNA methyltransferase [Mycoplasma sp. Ms02]|uniref:class I SAM-dependent RNA methyltransferase n=1 Tax=Mycoplasma sp. Ms02 TaxID=353851 RepID=UPI001C8AB82E|nr:methyltransferase domain-containing protein [Mycoplasma sp. Ms02]QZE12573.1 methyltransferase domain-containing protein [Mycoplasma sp. Ms02]